MLGVGDAAHLTAADQSYLDDAKTDGLGYTVLLRESGRGGNNTLTAATAVFLNRAAAPQASSAATWSRGVLSRSYHTPISYSQGGTRRTTSYLCEALLGVLPVELHLELHRAVSRQFRVPELRLVLVRPSLSFGRALLRLREARAYRPRRAITARDARFLLLVAALQGGAFALEHLGALTQLSELLQLRVVRLGLRGERAARSRVGGPPNGAAVIRAGRSPVCAPGYKSLFISQLGFSSSSRRSCWLTIVTSDIFSWANAIA
ncbi:hypothetical protein EDB85DRAFT_2295768, partial [Lactarius pseudohatsudake]